MLILFFIIFSSLNIIDDSSYTAHDKIKVALIYQLRYETTKDVRSFTSLTPSHPPLTIRLNRIRCQSLPASSSMPTCRVIW